MRFRYKMKSGFSISILFVVLCIVFSSCKKEDEIISPAVDNSAILALFEKTADSVSKTIEYPNLVFGVWMPDRNLTWIKNSTGSKTKTTVSSIDMFCIASITKTMTAVLTMQLVEKGKIRLTDNLDSLLPKNVLDTLKYLNANFRPSKINLKMLLNHTAALPDISEDSVFVFNNILAFPYKQWNPVEITAAAFDKKIDTTLIGQFNYSNTNYLILGLIIEKASGQKYDNLLKTNIFSPSGMGSSFLSGYGDITGKMAPGYFLDGKDVSSYNISWDWSCGGVISTVYDLYSFMHAFNAGSLVNNSSLSSMLTFKNYYSDSVASAGMGLGFFHYSWKGINAYGHSGATLGYSSVMYYVPSKNAYLIGYVNEYSNALPDVLLRKLFECL